MNRRAFVGVSAAAAAGWAARAGSGIAAQEATAPDLVLRGATVFDGTGAPGRLMDVAVAADRILDVGRVTATGMEEVDLGGLALAPGFVDIHSHADLSLFVNPRAESRIRQGVTLEVVGQDGSSVGPWSQAQAEDTRDRYQRIYGVDVDVFDTASFLAGIDRVRPAVNVATMVGHGTVRGTVIGFADRPASDGERMQMRALVRGAVQSGAVGLSSGLEYTPGSFADTRELVELSLELAGTGLPYASHMRNEDDHLIAAVEEALQVGRGAGVPVQVSHLKAQGTRNWWKAEAVLALIERARAAGVDVHFDRYPYVAYQTGLQNLFPASARAGGTDRFLARIDDPTTGAGLERAARDKIALLGSWDAVQLVGGNYAGRRLGELSEELGEEPYALTVRILKESRAGVSMIGFGMSEPNTEAILSHPLGMVCSDGGSYAPYGALSGARPHPRTYGSFPRFLGHYVRDRRLLPLEAAIHKITQLPATKLGIRDRGVVRRGAFADLVAFDPSTIGDRATFDDPHQYSIGIPFVVVNGVVTLRDGEHTGSLAGRGVRGVGARGSAQGP